MKKLRLSRKDILILSLIIIISLLIKIPAISDIVLAGDSVSLAVLGQNLSENFSYTINSLPHLHWPPLFPLTIAFFNIIFNNPVISIKIASILFSTLTLLVVYPFSRKLNFTPITSAIVTLLVLFNPFFMYYTSILPLIESLGVFLITLALYFYCFHKNNLILPGVLLGLALFAKFNFIGFIAPFLLLHGYYLLKSKNMKNNILFITLTLLPSLLWLVRNKLVSSQLAGSEFFNFLSASHLANMPSLAVAYMTAFFLLFLSLLPLIIASFIHFFRKTDRFWTLISVSTITLFLFPILFNYFYSNDLFFVVSRVRFYVILVPILTIMIFAALPKLNGILKYAKAYLAVTLIAFIILSMFLISGSLQDKNDIIPSNTFIERSYHRSEAITWANNNLPMNTKLLVYFNEQEYGMQGIEVFYKYYFNPTFTVFPIRESPSKKFYTDVSSLEDFKDIDNINRLNGINNINHINYLNYLNDIDNINNIDNYDFSGAYVISDASLEELNKYFPTNIILMPIHATKHTTIYSIYIKYINKMKKTKIIGNCR